LRLKADDKFRKVLWVRRALEPRGKDAPRRNQNLPTYLKRAARLGLKELDLDVRWGDGKTSLALRVVGVYLDSHWRLYLTTVPRELMSPSQLASTYRLRWLIEFLFREWKQQWDWGRSATADKNALFALTYATLFTHALVRSLRIAAALRHDVPLESIRPLGTLHSIRPFAQDLISALLSPIHGTWRTLVEHLMRCILLLAHELKPSKSRPRIAAQLGAYGP